MNKDNFGELVISCTDSLYRVAKTILHSDEDCKDAIQEAITKGFLKLDTLQKDKYAKTWLTSILINECYSILRDQAKNESIDSNIYEFGYEPPDNYTDLYNAIMALDRDYRICVVLYYIEGYKLKEISSMIDASESAIKKRLARAREKLKKYIEGGNDNEA